MATKDWKKIRERKISENLLNGKVKIRGTYIQWDNGRGSDVEIFPNFNSSYKQVYVFRERGNSWIQKSFKTKGAAIAYAKSYMRKH